MVGKMNNVLRFNLNVLQFPFYPVRQQFKRNDANGLNQLILEGIPVETFFAMCSSN